MAGGSSFYPQIQVKTQKFLQQLYVATGFKYLLFVGDLPEIPMGKYNNDPSDNFFSCLDGTDNDPDVAMGRFCPKDETDLAHQVAKTLNYYRNPPLDPWVTKSSLSAHEQENPGKYTQCSNEIRKYTYRLSPPLFDTCYPPEGATFEKMKAAYEEGRGIVNYRGHGDETSWSWQLTLNTKNVRTINFGAHTPVVWNICCLNGAIDSASESMTEAWMSAGADGKGGAVLNLAATRPSYTLENHTYNKLLYQAMFDQGTFGAGWVVNAAKVGANALSENGKYNTGIYFILGDPALDI